MSEQPGKTAAIREPSYFDALLPLVTLIHGFTGFNIARMTSEVESVQSPTATDS